MKILYTPKSERKQLKTQTDAIRILLGVIWFAFVVSACGGPITAPTPTRAVPLQAVTQVPGSAAQSPNVAQPTAESTPSVSVLFDGKHAYDEYLISQVNFGPRPAGSVAIRATGDYLIGELEKTGWKVEKQEFDYRGVPIRNIIAKTGEGTGPLVILGAHYDTRPRADMDKQYPDVPIAGANDGGSGVAVLLELARTLDKSKLENEVWLAFFDAEDNGGLNACDLQVVPAQVESAGCDTSKWNWSIGAEHVADNLPRVPDYVVVVDMVGDANQDIYYERNSDQALQEKLWAIADRLGYRQWFIPEERWSMTDDHTPFLNRGIRAIDIIDFDYPPWHTVSDTADKVSADSLERVGRVLQTWLETAE